MKDNEKFRLAPDGTTREQVKRGEATDEGETCLVAAEGGDCCNAPGLVWVVDERDVVGTICFDCLEGHQPELAQEALERYGD